MAPAEEAKLAELFAGCGLEPKTAQQVARNSKLSATLVEVIAEAGLQAGCGKVVGNLLYQTAAKARASRSSLLPRLRPLTPRRLQFPGNALSHRPTLVAYLARGDIKVCRRAPCGPPRRCRE